MLDRMKEGSPYLLSVQEARLRSRTIRKDLPLGRTHTHIIIIKERVNGEHDLAKKRLRQTANIRFKLTASPKWETEEI